MRRVPNIIRFIVQTTAIKKTLINRLELIQIIPMQFNHWYVCMYVILRDVLMIIIIVIALIND